MLLFDQNLSHKLPALLQDDYPGCKHVRDFKLSAGSDTQIWTCAIENNLAIITKDEDFFNRSTIKGHPPKVIHLEIGNCKTAEILELLKSYKDGIYWFLDQDFSYVNLNRPYGT